MSTARSIVITGGTRGIGLGLAEEFLRRGHAVCITSREDSRLEQAVSELGSRHGAERISGLHCDVAVFDQVEALWRYASKRAGRVDIWINNAGAANRAVPFWELDAAEIRSVIAANLTGLMYGTRVAVRGMLAQGSGAIFNFEGFGSGGQVQAGLSVYGASKRAVAYFTHAVARELEGTPVRIGTLHPGIVVTDLILRDLDRIEPARAAQARRIFNILADRVGTVTPFLVERMLASTKNGARIAWLTPGKSFARFAAAPFRKRDVLSGA